MKEWNNAAEGAKRITFLLGRLTVLRTMLRTEPAVKLIDLCDAMAAGDATASAARYHAMTAALLETPTRRVTGDVFKDFLFSEILESSNRFSVLAAANKNDPPVMLALAQDMRLLQELFSLTSQALIKMIGGMVKQVKKTAPEVRPKTDEKITNMANAAWGGGFFQRDRERLRTPEPSPQSALPDELELDTWVSWEYDNPGERVTYAADDGLAVIYRLFLAEEDWGKLVAPLYELHKKYGSGEFLRYRVFVATDEGLEGMELSDCPVWDEITARNGQKERLYANTLRFLHTGRGEHALLYGSGGMGKSSLVLALAGELPELRMIFLTQRDLSASMETLRRLSDQPFRFIAFMDDLVLSEREYKRLKAAVKSRLTNGNVLIYATGASAPPDSSVFGLELEFGMLTIEEFESEVWANIRAGGATADRQAVSDSCARWEEERAELSLRAAKRLAESIIRGLK